MLPRPAPTVPRRSIRLALTSVGLGSLVLLGACSGGPEPTVGTLPPGTPTTVGPGGTTGPDGTTDPRGTAPAAPRGTATITSFDLRNRISCVGTVDVTTGATYVTEGAATVAFVVDGTQVRGAAPVSGSFDIPISCDDRSHTVVLVAVDEAGGTTVESRVVLTSTTPQGN